MPKIKKTKKTEATEDKDKKVVIKTGGDEEEEPKEGSTLSDGVLDAFEPVDPLEDEDGTPVKSLDDIIDEEDKDDMDYNPDEW